MTLGKSSKSLPEVVFLKDYHTDHTDIHITSLALSNHQETIYYCMYNHYLNKLTFL